MGSVFNRLVRIAVMELVQGLKHERKETDRGSQESKSEESRDQAL